MTIATSNIAYISTNGDLRRALPTLTRMLDALGRGDDATRVCGRLDRLS